MKKITIAIFVLLAVLYCLKAQAFEYNDLNGKAVLSLLRTNDTQASNRINLILPYVEYQRLIYEGEYAFNFNDAENPMKYQQKSLVGVKILDGVSLRYQYENLDTTTNIINQKVVAGNIVTTTKIKETQWNDNRYGIGYRKFTTIDNTKIGFDTMIMKEELYDYRYELDAYLENKYVFLYNQFYSEYNGYNLQKFYDRIIMNYKLNSFTALSTQVAWETNKGLQERIGISFSF